MRLKISSQLNQRRLLLVAIFALISAAFSFGVALNTAGAQEQLSLADILTGLKSKKTTLAQRNKLLTDAVNERGVTFVLTAEIERELRATGANNTLIAAIRANSPRPTPTRTPVVSGNPSAVFKDLWIDYNVTENGVKGMRIHVKFTTYKMLNLDSYLAIYFTDDRGYALKDKNGKLASTAGDVAVYREMKPAYDPANYDDFSVFMPYAEFDLPDGNWDLKMEVKLIYKQGGLIQQLTTKAFNYKQGDTTERDYSNVTWKVNRVWVDYNITQNGRKGMLVHVNFEVTGLKGVSSNLSMRVQTDSGSYVRSTTSAYSNSAGQLRILFNMNPGYDTTVYRDATLFLPYSEINVSKGVWNLKLDIDLGYGDEFKHLHFEDFRFTQP